MSIKAASSSVGEFQVLTSSLSLLMSIKASSSSVGEFFPPKVQVLHSVLINWSVSCSLYHGNQHPHCLVAVAPFVVYVTPKAATLETRARTMSRTLCSGAKANLIDLHYYCDSTSTAKNQVWFSSIIDETRRAQIQIPITDHFFSPFPLTPTTVTPLCREEETDD
jgi:hypothetical protein